MARCFACTIATHPTFWCPWLCTSSLFFTGLYPSLASALDGTAPIEERRHVPFLDSWCAKAGVVFAAASFTEILQACGLPILGRTFDPLDFVMFAVGGLLAAGLDQGILALKTRKPRHGPRCCK